MGHSKNKTIDEHWRGCRWMQGNIKMFGFYCVQFRELFFFSFLSAPRHMGFPGQGSDPSHGCSLSCSCSNTLTTVPGQGPNPCPSASKTPPSHCCTTETPRSENFGQRCDSRFSKQALYACNSIEGGFQ